MSVKNYEMKEDEAKAFIRKNLRKDKGGKGNEYAGYYISEKPKRQ